MGILTRQQWKGVIDFSKAVDAEIVTLRCYGPSDYSRRRAFGAVAPAH